MIAAKGWFVSWGNGRRHLAIVVTPLCTREFRLRLAQRRLRTCPFAMTALSSSLAAASWRCVG